MRAQFIRLPQITLSRILHLTTKRNYINKNTMTAAIATPDITKSKRRVTFRPFIEVFDIPLADPEIKEMLWYSKCELFMIKLEVTRQLLIYKAIVGMKNKRAALDNDDASPAKRARILQGPIANEENVTENTPSGTCILPPHVPVVSA
jgi:hypothetical protein